MAKCNIMADYFWLLWRVNHLLCGVHMVFICILTVIHYTKSTRTKFSSKYLLKTGFLGKEAFLLEFSSSFSPSSFFSIAEKLPLASRTFSSVLSRSYRSGRIHLLLSHTSQHKPWCVSTQE